MQLETPKQIPAPSQAYAGILDVCLKAADCPSFYMWGFTDKYSWIPVAMSGYGYALIFDEDFLPKPAYHLMRESLSLL